MHTYYRDILSRIQEEPTWWDSNGCPRYGEFNPELSLDIYADEVILLLISCQSCRKEFKVEMHFSIFDRYDISKMPPEKLANFKETLESGDCLIHYGDPPLS